jgi:hypothetical protein
MPHLEVNGLPGMPEGETIGVSAAVLALPARTGLTGVATGDEKRPDLENIRGLNS